jgi:hypothetical protein
MTGWRQAVFVRQRRLDVIQRALSQILDEESWSPATPRRLHVGAADASSRGWTMIVPQLANFFLDRGGTPLPRLCRLARELRCPAYEVDVRDSGATTLFEADGHGQLRISGAPRWLVTGRATDDAGLRVLEPAAAAVSFGLLPVPHDVRERIGGLAGSPSTALADYLGALAGFPAWTRHGDDPIAAGALIYEPPRIVARGHTPTRLSVRSLGARTAIEPAGPRVIPPSQDRRGARPRSAARPRR